MWPRDYLAIIMRDGHLAGSAPYSTAAVSWIGEVSRLTISESIVGVYGGGGYGGGGGW